MQLATGPLAQSAERGADITHQWRRGREFEPLTDQNTFFSYSFLQILYLFPSTSLWPTGVENRNRKKDFVLKNL